MAKTKILCETSNHAVSDRFVDVNKTFNIPKGANKILHNYFLTKQASWK